MSNAVSYVVEWFDEQNGARNGMLGLLDTGELSIYCDDPYYNGRVSKDDAVKLALGVLAQLPKEELGRHLVTLLQQALG